MLEEYTSRLAERTGGSKDFFPGQLPGEKVIYFTRRHPLSFLGMILFALAMIILPAIVYLIVINTSVLQLVDWQMRIMIVIASAYFLFVLGFLLVAWIIYYFDVVIITNARIVDITQENLFARKISEANLTDVEDVNAEVKGILPTFFHFGTVHVQTAGTAENFEFDYLPEPYKVSKLISDLHEQTVEEAETREAREIGEVIAERTPEGQEASQEDIDVAAQKLAHHGKTHNEIDPQSETPKRQEEETSNYQESTGWKEMDNYQPPKENKPQPPPPKPKEESKPEPKKENDNSINHDDLEKGGEAEF
jgi:hypothetical protein